MANRALRTYDEPSMMEALQAAEKQAAGGFAARVAAMDRLERDVLDRLEVLDVRGGPTTELLPTKTRAKALAAKLEAAQARVFRRLGARIASGRYTPAGLRAAFTKLVEPEGRVDGYDALDVLVAGLFAGGAPSTPRVALEPEMVAYQPTPARAILSLLDRARIGPDDTVIDVGSGLGHVVLLVALLGGARARGIELEPAYGEHARRCASRLGVRNVELVDGDARSASLDDGTVYFLYTPFRGAMLSEVLERLRAASLGRHVRVCTYGPCTAAMAGVPWLRFRGEHPAGEREVAVFDGVAP